MAEQGDSGAQRVEVVRAVVPVELDLSAATRQIEQLEERLKKLGASDGSGAAGREEAVRSPLPPSGEARDQIAPATQAVGDRETDELTQEVRELADEIRSLGEKVAENSARTGELTGAVAALVDVLTARGEF